MKWEWKVFKWLDFPLLGDRSRSLSLVPSVQIKSVKMQVTWRNSHKSLCAFIFSTTGQKGGPNQFWIHGFPAWTISGRFQWVKSSVAFIQNEMELWDRDLVDFQNYGIKHLAISMSFEIFLLIWFCMWPILDYFEPHFIRHALSHTIKIINIRNI